MEQAGTQARNEPAAYLRNTQPTFVIDTHAHGTAPIGVTFGLTAARGQTPITLYQTAAVMEYTPGTELTAQAALADCVAKYQATLGSLQFYVRFTRQGWTPASVPRSSYPHALYATLAAPMDPMESPWVGVLEDACGWAQGATTATQAAVLLTSGVFAHSTYDGARTHIWMQYETTEDFSLLGFLTGSDGVPARYGQCMDFADYLVCTSRALGARPLLSQRSATLADMAEYYGHQFLPIATEPVTLPGQAGPPIQGSWLFHQWTIDTTVFDACVRLGGLDVVADSAGPGMGTAYFDGLVASLALEPVWWFMQVIPWRLYEPWNPRTPFMPVITN